MARTMWVVVETNQGLNLLKVNNATIMVLDSFTHYIYPKQVRPRPDHDRSTARAIFLCHPAALVRCLKFLDNGTNRISYEPVPNGPEFHARRCLVINEKMLLDLINTK
jgi:hypothetical protein